MRFVWVLGLVVLVACSDSEDGNANDFVDPELTQCLIDSGNTTVRCVDSYVDALSACRINADGACEARARDAGGALTVALDQARADNASTCTDDQTSALGYFGGIPDFAGKSADACARFGEGFADLAFASGVATPDDATRQCSETVSATLTGLRGAVVSAIGPGCSVLDSDNNACDRDVRDSAVEEAVADAGDAMLEACGDRFDDLRLSALGSTLEERIANLVDVVANRARNLALFAYPPNNIGATAEFGPFPVGLRTFEAVDDSRLNVPGTGPRPVTFDVYYPSTEDAVAGVPEEIFSVLGIEILPAPAFRDVDVAGGQFPMVLFSHGFDGIRFQSFFHVAHLASHGFIVVSPDHHGNTIPDGLANVVDTATAFNRAFDMKFLMDQIANPSTDAGALFSGSVDQDRIGMSGHSYGGYEAFILTGGEVRGTALDETTVTLGTFTDPRIKAIVPMAPRTMRRVDAVTLSDSYFQTVTVPTLVIGSELDMTDPFFVDAKRAFENLPIGAEFVGLAEILDGGHNTFTDLCELQTDVLDVVGGADEGCMPRHLPWKHAHDLINYLALNFFDATLNGNAEALDRLSPEVVGQFEDLRFWRK